MSEKRRSDTSILIKLNTWHIKQVFLNFIKVSIIMIILLSIAVFILAEMQVAKEARDISLDEASKILIYEEPKGMKVPRSFEKFFPEELNGAVRQFVRKDGQESFWRNLENTKYRVWIANKLPGKSNYYPIDYEIGEYFSILLKMLIILACFQAIFLVSEVFKGNRAIKRALKPIYDLTLSTRENINSTKQVLSDSKIRELKGTIDTIDVTDLDRRISIMTDQRELSDLADAINGLLERVNQAYRSQARFVSDASHELRTPIAVIQGYANLLDRWGKNDEKALQESIDAIKSEANNMKNLVEQLLFLARSDNNTLQANFEKINLSEIMTEVLKETEMIDGNHKYSSNIENDIFIIGDSQLIKQAIRIFVDNSMKFTPPDEFISIKVFSDGEIAKCVIEDNGVGIPEEDVPYIFDRFFRSDDSRARKTGGTGLGLSIAKLIIDMHKGSIEVLSRKDIGTRITINLCKVSPV